MKIPFNKPYFIGEEFQYIKESVDFGKISGDGHFTHKCNSLLGRELGVKNLYSPHHAHML